ncbi:MAG TPA: J domain-containing protein [Chthoniobacterales bacterium]
MTRKPATRGSIQRSEDAPEAAFEMILINQGPLRFAANRDCQAAMEELKEARSLWNHFERKDKPSFIRWRAREFGALLSKARDVEQQIRENEALVYEVELEMRRTIIDPHSAYQRVMYRRAHPSAPEEPRAADGGGRGRPVSEFEQETLFQEWVKKFVGTNPDKMDDEAYTASFNAFKSHMFATKPAEPGPNENRRTSKPRAVEVEEETLTPLDARVKELYRLLVRRLHPDLRADGNAAASSLWHDVQEAYAMGDVGRMELLLSLSDIEANAVSEETTLFQMRAVLRELQRALDALQRSLHEAKSDDAWDFAHKGADEGLHVQVEQQLQRNLVTRTTGLTSLQKIIADWAHPPGVNLRAPRVRQFAV